MAKSQDDQDLIISTQRRIYVDKIIIGLLLGLVILLAADFLADVSLIHENSWLMIPIIIGSALVVAIPIVPTQKILSLIVFISTHVLLAAFFIYFVPVGSPYEFIAVLVIYLTGWWYGQEGFFASSAAVITIFAFSFVAQLDQPTANDVFVLIIKTALFIIMGGVLARLHEADMVERQELFKTMREASFEHQRLRTLINSMADAVIATDYDGKILVYNGAALGLLNTNATLDGQPLRHFLKTYDAKTNRPVDLIETAKQAQTILKRDDLIHRISQAETMNLYVSAAQIHISYGEKGQEGFILLLRDITKEKSIEEQRDEFISVVSHELRTPIAITEANISTAMMPDIISDKKKMTDLLKQAHQNIIFLADMINDITTLAHAERGDLEAQIEDVDTAALMQDIAGTYVSEAKEKSLKLILDIDKKLPKIRSNNYRLKEILQDYVTNALKYTEKGSVTLRVTPIEGGIRFSVTDTGIGLSLSDRHNVFKKFWRSEDYRTRSHKGTGLGLYIAKKLAQRMHGKVGVMSELNKGSTFYLDVPLTIEPPKKIP